MPLMAEDEWDEEWNGDFISTHVDYSDRAWMSIEVVIGNCWRAIITVIFTGR